MGTYIVIPEGLAKDKEGNFHVSDYYSAALDLAILHSDVNDKIFLAPANSFGAKQEEDYYGQDYLLKGKCSAEIELIDRDIKRDTYFDTLDNAMYLKDHLLRHQYWPLEPVIIVCNKPHAFRSWLMFSLCNYKVLKVLVSRPTIRTERRIVKRLWFYDVIFVQYIYEAFAIVYNTFRFFFGKIN